MKPLARSFEGIKNWRVIAAAISLAAIATTATLARAQTQEVAPTEGTTPAPVVPQFGPTHQQTQDQHVLVKDWANTEALDPLTNAQVCRASTQTSQGLRPVSFAINFPKDGTRPPYMILEVYNVEDNLTQATVKIDNKTSHPFTLLHRAIEGEQSVSKLLYIPLDFPKLIAKIKAESWLDLMLDPKGTPVPVRISLKGSTNAVNQIAKCLGTTALNLQTDYFKRLNTKIDGQPNVTLSTSGALLMATNEAFAAYLQGQQVAKELAELKAKFKAPLAKQQAALKTFQDWEKKLNALLDKERETQGRKATAEAALNQANLDLKSLQDQHAQAVTAFTTAEGIYKPLLEQMKPYEANIHSARQTRDRAQSEVNSLNGIIRSNPGEISNLQSERSRRQSELSSLESDIDRLEREERDWDSQVSRYSVSSEERRILDSDWSYRRAQDQERNAERQLSSARSEYSRYSSEFDRAESELDRCRSEREREDRDADEARRPRPGKDCSALQSRVQDARGRRDNAAQDVRRAESEINDARRQISSSESNARSQAQDGYDRLRRQRDEVSSRLNRAESDARDLESRISSINSSISSLQQELSWARSNIENRRANLAQAQQNLANAQANRDQFATQIGFTTAEGNYRSTMSRRDDLAKAIKGKTAEITQLGKQIKTFENQLVAIAKEITKIRPSYDKAQAALQVAEAPLAEFRQQESALTQRNDAAAAAFFQNVVNYQKIKDDLSAL